MSRLHHLPFATEPSERGGRQERRRGPLMKVGRTAGRSNAEDCAYDILVVRWLLEELAQLRFAAASLGRSDRPRREWCSCCRLIVSDTQTLCAPCQLPGNCGAGDFSRD
jgi:hypothetical protein